jgi:hypothetical protein
MPGTPLRYVKPTHLTCRLRAAPPCPPPNPAYTAADVSARSIRAGGAMALFCAGIDSDCILLLGRWRSDEMYRYLFVQVQTLMTGLSGAMLRGGSFRFDPG